MMKKVAAVAAAAGGLVLAGAGIASADQGVPGSAANSPGLVSGNNIQVPVNADADVCGNTVSVIGLLNPAAGSACTN
ncbi:small secreted domain DUF320 [Streptomyces sp. Amel2xB2]|uniref:Chaplin n=1 Tax=Streptomyces nanshensis TaxID=518642 RepID=A0A1E7L9J5_9ACTN|nr:MULTISPECIES: chaplin [Streptomyces]OEV12905.1 chaplin [Streptomyces nanshensis]RAJ60020.1 small secreted domain DUF320 [Streptomyces sp. Amel2xB2]